MEMTENVWVWEWVVHFVCIWSFCWLRGLMVALWYAAFGFLHVSSLPQTWSLMKLYLMSTTFAQKPLVSSKPIDWKGLYSVFNPTPKWILDGYGEIQSLDTWQLKMTIKQQLLRKYGLYLQYIDTWHLVLSYSLPHPIKCGVLLYYLIVEMDPTLLQQSRNNCIINLKYTGYRACGRRSGNVTTALALPNINGSLWVFLTHLIPGFSSVHV